MNQNSLQLSEDAPLLSLIETPIHEMTDDELREHTKKLRELSSSSTTIRTQVKAEVKKKTTAKKKSTKKVDVNKYLDL